MLDFTLIVDKHIPLVSKRVKRRYQQDWMSDSILKSIKRRNNALKQHKYAEYKHFQYKTTKLIREAKPAFYSSQIRLNLHKPQNLSKILRNLNGIDDSTQNIEGLKTDNTILQGDLEIANTLNKHFTNIVDKYSNSQDVF